MGVNAMIENRRPLGDVLLHKGQIRKYQLEFCLSLQEAYRQGGRPFKLGEILVHHRVIDVSTLESALHVQETLPLESITAIIKEYENQVSKLTVMSPAELA